MGAWGRDRRSKRSVRDRKTGKESGAGDICEDKENGHEKRGINRTILTGRRPCKPTALGGFVFAVKGARADWADYLVVGGKDVGTEQDWPTKQ